MAFINQSHSKKLNQAYSLYIYTQSGPYHRLQEEACLVAIFIMETRPTPSSEGDRATCTALLANDGEERAIVEATINVELRLCFLAIAERMLTDFQARLFM
jgi:hypothetical protein